MNVNSNSNLSPPHHKIHLAHLSQTTMTRKASNEPEINYDELMKGWDQPVPDTNNRLKTGGMIVASSIAVILGFTAPFVFVRSPLPYMATPGPKIRHALQYLNKGNTKNNVFVDLGSGDGEAVYQAARLGYRAIGIELNFTMWAFSSVRRQLFWSASEKANSTLLWKNFFHYSLKDANTVMIFGVTPLTVSEPKDRCRVPTVNGCLGLSICHSTSAQRWEKGF